MLRTAVLLALVISLVLLAGSSVSQAAIGTTVSGDTPALRPFDGRRPDLADGLVAPMGSVQAFAPGQVLVRFKSDIPLTTTASLVAPHSATLMRQIADHTFALAVPAGREEQAVEALASNPAVQHASLNYRITETPIGSLEPVTGDPRGQGDKETRRQGSLSEIRNPKSESCITDLWMSTTQQGERLLENLVPSGTPQAYVFFEYTECDLEEIRVQVFYQPRDAAPEGVFDQQGTIISGSGIQGLKVQAWPYFEQGVFPVGMYLTSLSVSPEGGWDEVKNAPWRVSTFPNDHWFRGISNYQWPLHSTGRRALPEADINMPQAWDITTGSPGLVIAVVSTGVKIDHPDLQNKIWINRDEIPGNGIDDDENGCVDDVHGCEFFNGE
ncbi:MAG: hypothetical protein ACE5LU_24195, partial [Anaerolineae bacterium]